MRSARNPMGPVVASDATTQKARGGGRSARRVRVRPLRPCPVCAIILLLRFLNRRRNDLLGYLGERATAEWLEPLKAQGGYRIFHDVPCEGRKKEVQH